MCGHLLRHNQPVCGKHIRQTEKWIYRKRKTKKDIYLEDMTR